MFLKTTPSKINQEVRQEGGSLVRGKEVVGDNSAKALVQTLGAFTDDLAQWGEINNNTQEYWAKKGPKTANTLKRRLNF